MKKSTSLVMVAALFAIASGVASAQVPGDGIPDVYYFQGAGLEAMTSQGMISRPAGDLVLDTDGSDVVAFFVGGADISAASTDGGVGCHLCDGQNLPGTDGLGDVSGWTVGFSAGSTQWIRTDPLSGNGFRGVVGKGFLDGADAVQDWPEDFLPFVDFSDIGVGVGNYGGGLDDSAFSKLFVDANGGDRSVQLATDGGAEFFVDVTVVSVPEPGSFSLLSLAGLALLGLRRR